MAHYLGKLPAKNLTPRATPPCGGCTERTVGCHGSCTRYDDWHKDWMAKRKAQRLANRQEVRISAVLVNGACKTKTERKSRRADNA